MDIQFIENYIHEFDRIIVFDSSEQKKIDFWKRFCDSTALKQCEKKRILLLSNYTKVYDNDNIIAVSLSEEEKNILLRLYRMYEFTDKIIWIDDGNRYPGVLNYLESGIMKEEDLYFVFVN